ncbi:MAG: alpha-isopropylmalate synthase regulatory domain-containing protein, partial [Mucinivorans sp.]
SDDLPYIISDLFGEQGHQRVRILNYSLNLAQGLKPVATLKIEIDGELHEQTSTGDGQYDAFVSALRTIYLKQLGRDFPTLTDYSVSIPPGGRTDAFVQTAITWNFDGRVFKTKGLDVDQTEAAIKATIKMLNKI